jgi:arylsulfatase A-like enzyme
VPYWLFLRRGKYKYIRTLVPDEIEELYDLEADPQELKNLALDASQRPVLDDYRAHLRAELRRTAAGFVDNLPPPRH